MIIVVFVSERLSVVSEKLLVIVLVKASWIFEFLNSGLGATTEFLDIQLWHMQLVSFHYSVIRERKAQYSVV